MSYYPPNPGNSYGMPQPVPLPPNSGNGNFYSPSMPQPPPPPPNSGNGNYYYTSSMPQPPPPLPYGADYRENLVYNTNYRGTAYSTTGSNSSAACIIVSAFLVFILFGFFEIR